MIADDPGASDDLPEAIVTEDAVLIKEGRRDYDWRALLTPQAEISLFFWVFGMFLDDKKKPSMSRIMLSIMTFIGWRMFEHEIGLVAGQPSIQNAVWTAWWAAEGFLCAAVFVPSAALNYFSPGYAGAAAVSAIASATRDARLPSRLDDERDDKGK